MELFSGNSDCIVSQTLFSMGFSENDSRNRLQKSAAIDKKNSPSDRVYTPFRRFFAINFFGTENTFGRFIFRNCYHLSRAQRTFRFIVWCKVSRQWPEDPASM